MNRTAKIALGAVAALLFAASGGLLWKTHAAAYAMLHAPRATRHLPDKNPADYHLSFENVTVVSSDGGKLFGWFIPSENGAVIIMQHGYKSTRSEMLNEAEMMHRHGYGALITSIRAHDYCDGELITFGACEGQDLEAWCRFLLTRGGFDHEKIGIIGNSFGGMLAIQFAAQNQQIKAVVTNSAFSSISDTVVTSVRHYTGLPKFPFVPLILFWADRETGAKLENIGATQWISLISPRPVFLMQGGADTVISPSSGQILYDAAKEPRELWFDPALDHVKFDEARAEAYEARVSAFFDRYLLGK